MSHLLARILLIALASSVFSTSALAQSSHAGSWFQVEVIIFTQTSRGGSNELPRVDQLERPGNAQFLRSAQKSLSSGGGKPNLSRDPFLSLPRSERTLNHLAAKLERNSTYRVLYHKAWRQPIYKRQNSQPIYVRGGAEVHGVPELEGLLTPSVDFYLATEVDLRLSEPGSGQHTPVNSNDALADPSEWHQQAAAMEPEISARGGYGASSANRRSAVTSVALTEKRGRMRSTELHYFDHPRMGMILRYDRYTVPPALAPAPAAPTAPEPAQPAQ